jgi:hypothetical protein
MVLVIRDEDKKTFVEDCITEQGLSDQYITMETNLKRQGHLDELPELSAFVKKAIELTRETRALFIDPYCRVYNGNGIFVCVVAYCEDRLTMLELIKAEYHALELG